MSSHPLSTQSGASLIEMLVATALGLVVLSGASALLLHLLQQQAAAQHRLEQAEALRFASQVVGQHVRDAQRIGAASHRTLLELHMPATAGPDWQTFACMQTAENDRLQLLYTPGSGSLSCKNATTSSPSQVLIDRLGSLHFEYGCLSAAQAAAGTTAPTVISHTATTAAACSHGVISVIVHLTPFDAAASSPPMRWTLVNRATFWNHHTP